MSHYPEPTPCPNCGYHAEKNYCAECGQETHLHNESFWGLVMHFIGHYFHYDSKFWQTMKALWFSPGMLTVAYWQGQRARYIPPVSLYIFISAVYFLCTSILGDRSNHINFFVNNAQLAKLNTNGTAQNNAQFTVVNNRDNAFTKFINRQQDKIQAEYGSVNTFIEEKVLHNIPKVFFLMIPVMALILKILFARRKQSLFLHHAIFSLHYHSLWFSVFFISVINPFHAIGKWLTLTLLILVYIYMIRALRNAYGVTRLRAISYTWIIALFYGLFFGITFVLYTIAHIALV